MNGKFYIRYVDGVEPRPRDVSNQLNTIANHLKAGQVGGKLRNGAGKTVGDWEWQEARSDD